MRGMCLESFASQTIALCLRMCLVYCEEKKN